MKNVTYAFVSEDGAQLAFESKVNSFGIDHVTRKDLVSFYMNFSEKAYFDTGLLPVDGTGMLSIRKAGNHTQIGYQYKPGMYYINWGAYERDPDAASIYVAQPYRVVIADIYNDNLLGARTFYSPIPIQHPQTPLYHVNLPNINCKGYRGNGVGWICLYHNEDISKYPFNEKIAKILERCSGVEAYNDANMSETDGPRFYAQHQKPSYVWNPAEWEKYSAEHGVEWTLDPDLWIPVLVKDLDNQEKHDPQGVPLTYADAILGNYQAYYQDPIKPKLVNKATRQDLEVNNNDIFAMFKIAYNSSTEFGGVVVKQNPMTNTLKVREELSKVFVHAPVHEEEEENDGVYTECYKCGCTINLNVSDVNVDINGDEWCMDCSDNYLVWVDHLEKYVIESHDDLRFSTITETFYLLTDWNQKIKCPNCLQLHPYDTSNGVTPHMLQIWSSKEDADEAVCSECFETVYSCAICNESLPDVKYYNVHTISSPKKDFKTVTVCNACYKIHTTPLERSLKLKEDTLVNCICGELHPASDFQKLTNVNIGSTVHPIGVVKGMGTSIGSAIKQNPSLAFNIGRYADMIENSLDNVTFSVHIFTEQVCPGCYLDLVDKKFPEFTQHFTDNVESKLMEIIFVQNSLDNLYGTAVNIMPNF